jgi:hypothetical protein
MEVRQGATDAQPQIAMLCGKASRIPQILPLCKTDADKKRYAHAASDRKHGERINPQEPNLPSDAGAKSFAGVLAQCAALARLNLEYDGIGAVGKGRLRTSWRGQAFGLAVSPE